MNMATNERIMFKR